MTQPAVSKAIAELEAILDVQLFDRSRRSLTLTAAGEMFARFAQAGMATVRQGLDTLEEARSGAGFVAFGALPTVAAGLVPKALVAFSAGSFACRTRVESGPSPYLLGLLRTAAIDFVVGRLPGPAAMDGLSFEQLYAETLALVVRPGHPLAEAATLSIEAVARHQLLLPPAGAIIRPAVDALLIGGGVGRPQNPIETVSNSLGRAYALASDAVWIISESVVARDLAAGVLRRLPVETGTTEGAIGITTRSGAELSPPSRALLDCFRAAT